jgi:L-ascorbate metabolism protein UlaG (beta-lactamase superfamily)
MIRYIKIFFQLLVGLIVLVSLSLTWFMYSSPQFGKSQESVDKARFELSINYESEQFINQIPTHTGNFFRALLELPKMMDPSGNPKSSLPTDFSSILVNSIDSTAKITWFGHSTFLVELEGKRILIDPMFGENASPFPFGGKRFEYSEPIPISSIKDIDVVLISHDHYDHLDYGSIKLLKDEVDQFIVPLGVGAHLKLWEVSAKKIVELDWWEDILLDSVTYTATPARHFSGRGLTDRNATQWAGWSIATDTEHLFFSGDGGYGPHFKEIAKRLPPINFAMLECGQYNTVWADIHMMPEETVQAALDLNAAIAMPIHWGGFRLAPHAWDDSAERFTNYANEKGVDFTLPKIGVPFTTKTTTQSSWWTELD